MAKIDLDKEWGFIVGEMKDVPREFPPMVVACRELLCVMRGLLENFIPAQSQAYLDFKKIYQRQKKALNLSSH